MKQIADHISAWLGVEVSEAQAQALADAQSAEDVVAVLREIGPLPPKALLPLARPVDLTSYGCTDINWRTGMEYLDPRALGADHG